MKAIFLKFQRFFRVFGVCFDADAFDTDTFQHAKFICMVNRFRVMVDFVRDPNKFQIL